MEHGSNLYFAIVFDPAPCDSGTVGHLLATDTGRPDAVPSSPNGSTAAAMLARRAQRWCSEAAETVGARTQPNSSSGVVHDVLGRNLFLAACRPLSAELDSGAARSSLATDARSCTSRSGALAVFRDPLATDHALGDRREVVATLVGVDADQLGMLVDEVLRPIGVPRHRC